MTTKSSVLWGIKWILEISNIRQGQLQAVAVIVLGYSHLSNKRDVTLTDFEKFHPSQKKIPPPQNRFFLKLHKNCLS